MDYQKSHTESMKMHSYLGLAIFKIDLYLVQKDP